MNKQTWILQAPVLNRSGYGSWSDAIAGSLIRYSVIKDFNLLIGPTAWGSCPRRNLEHPTPDTSEIIKHIIQAPINRQPEVFLQMSIPPEFQTPAKFNIGLSAGLESTCPPGSWLEGINRMNLNILTSVHSRDVLAGASYTKKNPNGTTEPLAVNKPMEVLFWGADTSKYFKTDEKVASLEDTMKDIPESFAFLFVGQWTSNSIKGDRKAIGFLVKIFLETFADVPNPPCLILKTSGAQICVMDRYECINKVHDITGMVKQVMPNAKLPNVYVIYGELEDNEMNALYNHEKVKMHVSFTHGEGFGMPLLLASLSGKPVVSSKWSGHLDFLNPNYTKFFDGSLVPIPDEALNDWFIKEAKWFEVDYIDAGKKMKRYFTDYSATLLENAEKLRVENMEKFSLEAMDKVFHAILDKYVPPFVMESSIILPKLKKLSLPKLNQTPVIPADKPEPATTILAAA